MKSIEQLNVRPRIRSLGVGQDGRRLWCCMGSVGIGSGYSPEEAYEGWRSLVRAYLRRVFKDVTSA